MRTVTYKLSAFQNTSQFTIPISTRKKRTVLEMSIHFFSFKIVATSMTFILAASLIGDPKSLGRSPNRVQSRFKASNDPCFSTVFLRLSLVKKCCVIYKSYIQE